MYEREMSWTGLWLEFLGYGGAPKDDWKTNATYAIFGFLLGAAYGWKHAKK